MNPGDVLKRKRDKSEWVVAGLAGSGYWVLRPLDFGTPQEFSDKELLRDFDAADTARPEDEQALLRRRDVEATAETSRAYGRAHGGGRVREAPAPPEGSPEATFAALAADTDE